jgi:hypothetical protein
MFRGPFELCFFPKNLRSFLPICSGPFAEANPRRLSDQSAVTPTSITADYAYSLGATSASVAVGRPLSQPSLAQQARKEWI